MSVGVESREPSFAAHKKSISVELSFSKVHHATDLSKSATATAAKQKSIATKSNVKTIVGSTFSIETGLPILC